MGKRKGLVLGSVDEEQQREELKKKKEAKKAEKARTEKGELGAESEAVREEKVDESTELTKNESAESRVKESKQTESDDLLENEIKGVEEFNNESAEAKDQEPAKPVVKKPRQGKAKIRSKKYTEKLGLMDREKLYELDEAIKLAKETSYTKFDATIEVHVNLGIDASKTDQNLRIVTTLPNTFGAEKRVAVVVSDAKEKEAKSAGADVVGGDNLIADIEKGKVKMDVLIATPDMMPKLGKIAKILGPKGLMPNPKLGTVTEDIAGAVKAQKGGQRELKNDDSGNIHFPLGKASMTDAQIKENFEFFLKTIKENQPQTVKKSYIKTVTLCSTMGPGIKVSI